MICACFLGLAAPPAIIFDLVPPRPLYPHPPASGYIFLCHLQHPDGVVLPSFREGKTPTDFPPLGGARRHPVHLPNFFLHRPPPADSWELFRTEKECLVEGGEGRMGRPGGRGADCKSFSYLYSLTTTYLPYPPIHILFLPPLFP